ncbi:uncharacterized protein [Diabrotica undecimpunctata]|uniref:uncharacterized protein n=1 Tax=Diabrotica undecimpunctata TaxID=50387 RepID=UPI003B638B7F
MGSYIRYIFLFVPFDRSCTKRHILSEISRIFDPLGFVLPCLLLAKRLLQRLWELKVPWDEILFDEITEIWTFKTELPNLADIKIARYLGSEDISRIELHRFCNASQLGYASVVYFRIEETTGNIKTFLVGAKCKVASLKTQSIARLELLAAVLLANLINFIQKSYDGLIMFDAVYAWSDSMITLAWLSLSPSRWKTFIANRVSHRQETVPSTSWHHMVSSQNTTDYASRGQSLL